MSEIATPAPAKRGPGRPRKSPLPAAKPEEIVAAPAPVSPKYKMKAKPNWEDLDASAEDTPDRLRISRELIPDGLDMQWVTESVYGQSMAQHRAEFERKGWTPVHQTDFDGQFNGLFMPKGAEGEIKVDGLVLMARPMEASKKAKALDKYRANEQVYIKEQALRGGDIPIALDARHPSALTSNRINKTIERIEVPGDSK